MRRVIVVHPHGVAMQADPRHQRARGEQHDARAVAAEVGIELERARHHRRRGHAAAAVADDDDLIGLVGAGDLDKPPRAGLDAASKHDGPPRAYSRRYGQWLLICTTKNRLANGRSSLKQTIAAATPAISATAAARR